MSDAVEIRFRADLADLESGTEDAVALIRSAADAMAEAFAPRGDSREGGEARRIADETLRIDEQVSLKEIAIAENRNASLYRLGEESLDQWKAEALAEENAKYAAELAFLEKKTEADRGDAAAEARDLEQRGLLHEEHVLALQKIDERYREESRTQERAALQEFIAADNAKLQDGLRALNAQFNEHKLGAGQRYQLEQQLTAEIYGEELKRVDALIATLSQGTKAYEDAIRQRARIGQEFARQSEAETNRLEQYEAQKWTQLGNSIKSSFNAALDGMLFEGNTFSRFMINIAEGVAKAFLQMGETIAENWIEQQIAAMVETKATQGTAALGQISDAAGVAAANAYAAYAAMPPVATAMAAEAAATTLGFSSFLSLATGAWELKSDAFAQLHKGEMVVPENFARGFRNNGGGFGAGDISMNYAPTINARDPASLKQMLVTESSEMLSWLQRAVRNGSLRFT